MNPANRKTNKMKLDEGTKRVVEMYSKYPFPLGGNHHNFFQRSVLPAITLLKKDYPIRRLLEAGCGTGNITAEIGASLPEVEIVAVDLTDESLALARQTAAQRKLSNVTFQKSNLMELDPELGVFDFVYSQGVIHHLSDPLTGMKNLNRYLKPGHHAFIWLYSLLGRRRILEMREALKILGVESLPWEQKLQLATEARPLFLSQRLTLTRKVIKVLEYFDKHGFNGLARYLYGHFRASPPGTGMYSRTQMADQILHPQDKYYRFSEAADLFDQSGFELTGVLSGMSNTLDESFGPETIFRHNPNLSRRDAYVLIELHEQPEGVGYLIKKTRELSD
jgi:ubiquinone/menaquinone biosynthesis C-methylase UbiE